MSDNHPTVSVIIPAKNAAELLPHALKSVSQQSYPKIIETIVAAGDVRTAGVARSLGTRVVENVVGTTPAGLNLAFEGSRGEIIVRCDTQSEFSSDYVATAVATLLRTGAECVGGLQKPVGESFWQRSNGYAMSSWIGSGGARYRVGGVEGPVDTVYLGVFRRGTLEALNGFDESFARTQDFELNYRIIRAGGCVWFDPRLCTNYTPRGSLKGLARQYFRYGAGKRQFGRKHRGELRFRQLGLVIGVTAIIASSLAAIISPVFLAAPAAYLAALILGAIAAIPRVGLAAVGVPASLIIMHFSWVGGFATAQIKPD
jgi:glycosyltransferase involved in cell wall biosynthesis